MKRILASIECGVTLADIADLAGWDREAVLLFGLAVLAIVATAAVWSLLKASALSIELDEEPDDVPLFHL